MRGNFHGANKWVYDFVTLFIENYVAASTLARRLNMSIVPTTFERQIVFVRDPVKRFWSAVKKQHPIADMEGGIAKALYELGNAALAPEKRWFSVTHFAPQVTNLEGKTIGHVIPLDSVFMDNLKAAIFHYPVRWIENFHLETVVRENRNATDNSRDAEAAAYITGTPAIIGRLKEYYADDFAWWNDPRSKITA